MRKKRLFRTFFDLLRNEKFLLWRISHTEEMDAYWGSLLEQYPDLDILVQEADVYLKEYIFPKVPISAENKEVLLSRIRESLGFKKRKTKQIRLWMKYAEAACGFFAVSLLLYHLIGKQTPSEVIIINLSHDVENIQLITANKTTSFSENVDLEISEDGTVRVNNQEDEKEGVRIELY